jgi:YebC/PmpR family DNA-binding regulatory protein
MSGHSKWSTIKHKKSREDAKRGKLFSKLSRYIAVAARQGGSDPDTNHTLAAAIQKAKDYNMPADNIERAIKRGSGEMSGVTYEQITYEGYGPDGVALLVEIMTDNRNRAASEIRQIFSKHNGKLGSSGSVAWMFDRKGLILLSKSEISEDELIDLAIEAGAEDVKTEGDHYEIITEPTDLAKVRSVLEKKGLTLSSAELTMIPKSSTVLDKNQAKKLLKLVDALEENDDVQEVYSNFDIPDSVMEEIASETT